MYMHVYIYIYIIHTSIGPNDAPARAGPTRDARRGPNDACDLRRGWFQRGWFEQSVLQRCCVPCYLKQTM